MPELDPVYEAQAKLIASRVADLLRNRQCIVPEFINPMQASTFLSLPHRTLENLRVVGRDGPPFSRIGRLVRYRVSDLVAWMEGNRA